MSRMTLQKTARYGQFFLVSLCLVGVSSVQSAHTFAQEADSSTMAVVNGDGVEMAQSTDSTYPWTAQDLAQAAYEGHLDDEGIPGYQMLATECRSGLTTARDVLRAAVKAGMMPSKVMDDAGYLEQLRISLSEVVDVACR
jgi:hypothetical protein